MIGEDHNTGEKLKERITENQSIKTHLSKTSRICH